MSEQESFLDSLAKTFRQVREDTAPSNKPTGSMAKLDSGADIHGAPSGAHLHNVVIYDHEVKHKAAPALFLADGSPLYVFFFLLEIYLSYNKSLSLIG
jgi:hypothetical protein